MAESFRTLMIKAKGAPAAPAAPAAVPAAYSLEPLAFLDDASRASLAMSTTPISAPASPSSSPAPAPEPEPQPVPAVQKEKEKITALDFFGGSKEDFDALPPAERKIFADQAKQAKIENANPKRTAKRTAKLLREALPALQRAGIDDGVSPLIARFEEFANPPKAPKAKKARVEGEPKKPKEKKKKKEKGAPPPSMWDGILTGAGSGASDAASAPEPVAVAAGGEVDDF